MKDIKKMAVNLALNLLPLVIVMIMSAIRISGRGYKIANWQALFVVLVMPVFLLIVNYRYALKNEKYFILHKVVIMCFFEYVCSRMGLWAWKVLTRLVPDTETMLVINFGWEAPSIIIVVAGVIFQIILLAKYFLRRDSKNNTVQGVFRG